MAIEKHRDEKDKYELDFGPNRLGSSENITSVVEAKIRKRDASGLGWTDVTAQFGTLGEAIDATLKKVEFTLNAAAASTDQLPGPYQVYIEVATDLSRNPIATKLLSVTGKASTT